MLHGPILRDPPAKAGGYLGETDVTDGCSRPPTGLDFPEEANVANGISRRDFNTRMTAATAGAVLFGKPNLRANDRVVLASIGIRGQGNSLKRGFARLSNVEIKTLVDPDGNLAAERINDAR